MTQFYAQPYSLDHTGFYFSSSEEYDAGIQALQKKGCDEVEIQFIDGEDHLADIAKAAGLYQNQIKLWFYALENIDEHEGQQLLFLLECGYSLDDALERYEDVQLYAGTKTDYAYELMDETSDIPESLRGYIDYDAIARDMELNGEITEIHHELLVTNANEF